MASRKKKFADGAGLRVVRTLLHVWRNKDGGYRAVLRQPGLKEGQWVDVDTQARIPAPWIRRLIHQVLPLAAEATEQRSEFYVVSVRVYGLSVTGDVGVKIGDPLAFAAHHDTDLSESYWIRRRLGVVA